MKAIGYATPGTLDRDDALVDIEIDRPSAKGRDLLVAVTAVSVNPLDTKVRRMAAPEPEQWKVLGWDAVGRVVAIGELVTSSGLAIGSTTRDRSPGQAPTANFIWSTSA